MKNQLCIKKWSAGLFVALLTFALSMGIFIACKDDKEVVSNEVQEVTNSYLRFDGKALNHVNADFRKIKAGDGYEKEFNILMTSISSPNMDNILSKLKTNFKINEDFDKANLIVIYLKKDALSNVSLDEVAGVSIWQSKDKGVSSHKLYRLNNENILELDPKYSVNTGKLLNRDINYLSISVLKNNPNINWVAYSITNDNYRTSSLEKPYIPDFTRLVMNYSDVILSQAAVMSCSADGCGGAGSGCDPIGGCESTVPTCLLTNLDVINKGRLTTYLNLDIARDIRDNYMSKSKMGNQYVLYYNKLSQVINNLDTRTSDKSLNDYWTMYNDLISIVEKLKEGDSQKVVLDEEKKDRFLEMIAYYKPISANKEYQAILNQIETDLKNISEKPKKEVLNIIE
jgi:hypothetical protein